MFEVQTKQLDMDHQDQRSDREEVDTEMKQGSFGSQTPSQSKSAEMKASKPFPCCCGKSALSAPGGSSNKGSVSCLPAISSGSQSMTAAELAGTSKIPHRSRCNKEHPGRYHNKLRPAHVTGRLLNGSTREDASNTHTEEMVADPEHDAMDNFLTERPATPFPFLSTFADYIISSESESEEEEEVGDDILASWQDTRGESDTITLPRSFTSSLSPSTYCLRGLQSFTSQPSTSTASGGALVCSDDECSSVNSLPEQTRERQGTPMAPRTDRLNMGCLGVRLYPSRVRISLSYSPATSFINWEEDIAEEDETSTGTDTLQCPNETLDSSANGELDGLNVHDGGRFGDIGEITQVEECQAAHEGATGVQNAESIKDCSKEVVVCRHKQRLLLESSNDEEKDLCRICHDGDCSPTNPLISPCLCSGSMQFIHLNCLKRWVQIKIQSGSGLYLVNRCELCLGGLKVDPDTFDLYEHYRLHHEDDEGEFSELYSLREAAAVLHAFSSVLTGGMMPVMTPLSPVPRIRIWPMLPYLIRLRLRRIRQMRSISPELPAT